MPRALTRGVLLSLVLHALLLALLLHSPRETKQQPLEIRIVERAGRSGARAGARGHARRRERRANAHQGDLSRFAPRGLDGRKVWKNDFLGGANDTAIPQDEWGSGGGDLRQLKHLNQYQRLFDEIEGLLYYPGRLGYHGYGGTVNVRLVFDNQSRCDWRRSKIYGAHPYLRFFVLSMMKRLCSFETVEHLRFREGQRADLSFAFDLIQFSQTSLEQSSQDHLNGNVLSFYRSFVYSKLEYRLGPLHGYWFVPVVNIDFEWLGENWEKYVQGHDPLKEFKD